MSAGKKAWVIDDERNIRWVLEKALTQNGWEVSSFDSADKALNQLSHSNPDVVITDIRMPGTTGLEFLEKVKETRSNIPVIVMTAHSDLDSAVASIQKGAFEYLPKPFEVDEAIAVVDRALEQSGQRTGEASHSQNSEPLEIIGKAPAMQEVFRAIGRLSKSNVSVLINGQSGTGKERVAHALHKHSARSASTFIPLNMAAIPQDLIESELFGHERGAFTGASQLRQGRFEQAEGGTLFLDEIGDMPKETQTRLLRVLSDGEFFRVGGLEPIKANVRIIAATHQDLEALVREKKFREDLFHRLNVIRIQIPTLAERKEDIPFLAEHFLTAASEEMGEEIKRLNSDTLEFLSNLPWPGNVRQLENTCRWISVMAPSKDVKIEDLPPELLETKDKASAVGSDWEKALRSWASTKLANRTPEDPGVLDEAIPKFEKIMILSALKQTGGRKREASLLLGWGRNTLTRKISELRLIEEHLI